MDFPPDASNPHVFSELLEKWDFDDCCLRAEDTLAEIWRNIGPAYAGDRYAGDPYYGGRAVDYKRANLDRVMEFWEALQGRLSYDGSHEHQVLEFAYRYVDLVKDFLRERFADEPEDDPHVSPEKLAHYVKQFESLPSRYLKGVSPGYRPELERRAKLATEWCRKHLQRLQSPPPKRRGFWGKLFG